VFPLLGVVALIVLGAIVYISYTANNGLPLLPTYKVSVDVPNADRMIRNNEVRIGGIRVGQVSSVKAMPGAPGEAPYTRIGLKLKPSAGPLPVDTHVKVRPASILGTTYVDLVPGRSTRTLHEGGTLPLRNAASTVELTDLLDIFNAETARNVQATLAETGVGVAGRGMAFNATIESVSRLLPPLQDVLATVAAPGARFAQFLRGFEGTVAALAPVSDQLAGIVSGGATTFTALAGERAALGDTIEKFPGTATAATIALTRLRPALDGLAGIAVRLEPGVADLPSTLPIINSTLLAGVRPLRQLPTFTKPLRGTLAALQRLGRDPNATGAFRKLGDLLDALRLTTEVLLPAQLQCNTTGVFAEAFASSFAALGAGDGPSVVSLTLTPGALGESLQNANLSPNIGVNYLSRSSRNECEAGNEPYPYTFANALTAKPLLNNPPGFQANHTRLTSQDPRVREAARKAGLVDPPKIVVTP
jgi:virulence factor Mce-like protein